MCTMRETLNPFSMRWTYGLSMSILIDDHVYRARTEIDTIFET